MYTCVYTLFLRFIVISSNTRKKLWRPIFTTTAARLISNVPRYIHTTPVLCSLHWLPVKFRIDSKRLSLIFKAIFGHAPGYLIDLIVIKEQPHYNLRSVSGLQLS